MKKELILWLTLFFGMGFRYNKFIVKIVVTIGLKNYFFLVG